jgi:uncharacterized protein YacL
MPALLIVGTIMIIGGLALFISWINFFLILIKALLPIIIISLGAVMTYFGWEEKRDRKGALLDFSSPAEASRYQAEARAYQESIKDLNQSENDVKEVVSDSNSNTVDSSESLDN